MTGHVGVDCPWKTGACLRLSDSCPGENCPTANCSSKSNIIDIPSATKRQFFLPVSEEEKGRR